MIFQLLTSGEMSLIDGNNTVYQGQNNAVKLFVIAPVAPPAGLQIAFTYPDGTVSDTAIPMEMEGCGALAEAGNNYVWSYALPYRVTQIKGEVGVSINVVNNRTNYVNNQTTYTATINVAYSALPAPRADYDTDDWQDVLDLFTNYYNWVSDMGDKSKLDTTDKSTLVNAINEVKTLADNAQSDATSVAADLATEIEARRNADTALQDNIDSEETARENADAALQQSINGVGSRVSTLEGQNLNDRTSTNESEIDALQSDMQTVIGGMAELDDATQAVWLKVGNADISAVASNLSKAVLSLSDDVDALQNGLVPRINRGIMLYPNPATVVDAALATALTAKIVELTGRQPNNTDKLTVQDSETPDAGSYWTYNYWTGFDEVTDGWYWDSYSQGQSATSVPSYLKNILTTEWGEKGADNLYHITITAATHQQGTDKTVLVDLFAVIGGKNQRINTFAPSANGDVDIYTDETFNGYVVIRSAESYFVSSISVGMSQVIGLNEALAQKGFRVIAQRDNDVDPHGSRITATERYDHKKTYRFTLREDLGTTEYVMIGVSSNTAEPNKIALSRTETGATVVEMIIYNYEVVVVSGENYDTFGLDSGDAQKVTINQTGTTIERNDGYLIEKIEVMN